MFDIKMEENQKSLSSRGGSRGAIGVISHPKT